MAVQAARAPFSLIHLLIMQPEGGRERLATRRRVDDALCVVSQVTALVMEEYELAMANMTEAIEGEGEKKTFIKILKTVTSRFLHMSVL